DAELASERARLVHAERLGNLVGGAESGVYSGEVSAVDTLGRALAALREAERLDAGLGAPRALVEQALAELEEAGAQLGRYARSLAPDPARLGTGGGRLAALARLQKKDGGSGEGRGSARGGAGRELCGA